MAWHGMEAWGLCPSLVWLTGSTQHGALRCWPLMAVACSLGQRWLAFS